MYLVRCLYVPWKECMVFIGAERYDGGQHKAGAYILQAATIQVRVRVSVGVMVRVWIRVMVRVWVRVRVRIWVRVRVRIPWCEPPPSLQSSLWWGEHEVLMEGARSTYDGASTKY